MTTSERRAKILKILQMSSQPVAGKEFAAKFGVSRQVIVQDMAVLRASTPGILSTTRGYSLQKELLCTREFKLWHPQEETSRELNLIVDCGGSVKNTSISHRVYGRVTVDMDIHSRQDVAEFIDNLKDSQSSVLSSATSGYHYHLVEAASEERLDLIGKLRRKYGRSVADVLLFREKAAKDLDRLEHADDLSGQLKKTLVKQEEILSKASAELSRLRREIAVGFEKKVEKELHDLGMQHAQFQVSFLDQNKTDSRFTPNGIDEVEFTMTANLGQPLRPLARVASGGELSRIMLAVKNLEAEQSGVPSMVFDEIDTGISGRMAQVVAEKMAQIAEGHQVICVTHLPQIAAMADAQYIVEKGVEQGKTRTSVLRLDDRGRSEELARMVGGAEATSESSLRHARTLLAEAAQRKGNLLELSRKSE